MFVQRLNCFAEASRYRTFNFYTCTNPFIHLLGSSLIQWMIVRINGRDELKQDLQVHLGEAMLCLGALEREEIQASGSPRHSDLRLGMHSYA